MPTINQELCALIRKAQGERSQNQFALQCGISSSSLSRISQGSYTPTAKALKKISQKAHNGITYKMLLVAAGLDDELSQDSNAASTNEIKIMQITEIKSYMKQNNITYEQLSESAKIPIGTLKSIFSGRTPNPRIDTVQAIETALGLSADHNPNHPTAGANTGKAPLTEIEYELVEYYRMIKTEDKKLTARAVLKTLAETE